MTGQRVDCLAVQVSSFPLARLTATEG